MSRRKRRRKREAFADAMRSLPFRPRCRPTGADRHGPAAGEGAAPGAANVATSVSFVNASRPCATSMREPPTDADDDRSCACDGTAKRPLERQLGRISRFNTHRPVANAASRRGLSSRRRRNACRLHQLHERGMLCRDKQTEGQSSRSQSPHRQFGGRETLSSHGAHGHCDTSSHARTAG